MVVVGDHKAKVGEDKRRKKEAFIALHRMGANMDHLQTMTFAELDKNFISVSMDPESGTMFVCEYGPDILVFRYPDFDPRITNDSLHLMQQCKNIHVDYPFQTVVKGNRLYTSSLSQGMSAVEFSGN